MIDEASEAQKKFMRDLKLEVPENLTKVEAKMAIQHALDNKPEKPVPVVKPGVPQETKVSGFGSKHTTMYVSYAKDIFCALLELEKIKSTNENNIVMNQAIDLVKQAKEAFS